MHSIVPEEAGVDEAGCGSLVGPLVAAAVVLPHDFDASGLNDSKKLSKTKRVALFQRVAAQAAVGIGVVSLDEINAQPFGWARRAVFARALSNLPSRPATIVVDGTHFFDGFDGISYACIAKADEQYASVAAASIVAKCTRDDMVDAVCDQHPELSERYGWRKNMGYPTKQHKQALDEHGCTFFHRATFAPCRSNVRLT